jgi:transcriptional regulator with XRE-family HTH domain
MTFSKRLEALIKENKTTQKALADFAKIRQASISDWKNNGSFPRADIAIAIADFLQCSVKWLITGVKDRQDEFSIEERNLITKYRSLDDQGQYEVRTLIDAKIIPIDKSQTPA